MIDQRLERVQFAGNGGVVLVGLLHLPARPRGAVVVAHCFTCSKNQLTTARLARALGDRGFVVLRFDFAGLGQSGGDFALTSLRTNVADVAAAVELVRTRSRGAVGLVGHSMGGMAALFAARDLPDVAAVAVIATPSSPGHIRRLLDPDALASLRSGGQATITVDGRDFDLSAEFLAGLDRYEGISATAHLGRPLLVVHGGGDGVVARAEAEALHASADDPRELVVIPGAGHLFADRDHAATLAEVVGDFLARSLVT